MENLKAIKGAVFFVDILGISALTNNLISLKEKDFTPWITDKTKYTNQYLGATILEEFRSLLENLNTKFKTLRITQLSDCAFIWSESITEVIMFCSQSMHKSVKKGILCRGGLAYGEIIESQNNGNLGKFILGDAVTQSAKLESLSKGNRVLMNIDFPHSLFEQNKDFSNRIYNLFQPFTNPLDFQVYEEFQWYLVPELTEQTKSIDYSSFEDKVKYTKNRLLLALELRINPKFNWNKKNKQGQTQLNAGIRLLSKNKLMNVLHNFEWETFVENGSNKNLKRQIENIIDYPDYRKYEEDAFPDDWY